MQKMPFKYFASKHTCKVQGHTNALQTIWNVKVVFKKKKRNYLLKWFQCTVKVLAGCSGAVSPCGCVALQITFSLRILLDITGIPFKLLVSNLLGLLNFPVTRLCKSCFGFPSKFSLLPAACLCHICVHCAAAGSAVPPRLGSAEEPPDDLAASQRWPASQVAKFCHPFSATWAKRPSREASGRQGAPGFHFPSPPALVGPCYGWLPPAAACPGVRRAWKWAVVKLQDVEVDCLSFLLMLCASVLTVNLHLKQPSATELSARDVFQPHRPFKILPWLKGHQSARRDPYLWVRSLRDIQSIRA